MSTYDVGNVGGNIDVVRKLPNTCTGTVFATNRSITLCSMQVCSK